MASTRPFLNEARGLWRRHLRDAIILCALHDPPRVPTDNLVAADRSGVDRRELEMRHGPFGC